MTEASRIAATVLTRLEAAGCERRLTLPMRRSQLCVDPNCDHANPPMRMDLRVLSLLRIVFGAMSWRPARLQHLLNSWRPRRLNPLRG